MRRSCQWHAAAAVFLMVVFGSAQARQGEPPYSLAQRAKVGLNLPIEDVAAIDAGAWRATLETAQRRPGMHTKRLQVALGNALSITPVDHGRWDALGDGSQLWRTRVRAAGATDLRLGFNHFALPPGATLYVIGADDYYQGPYTAADATGGRFDAPVVPGDTATIELRLPANAELAPGAFALDNVGAGFRDAFGREKAGHPGASGACNVNVVCPLGQPYANEARAVGFFEFRADDDHNYYLCTGTLLADVPRTRRNWFLTAAHCISSSTEAASMVVYWNYQSTQCSALAAPNGGFFNDDQHGAALRATRGDVDFSLLELSGTAAAEWNLYRAGWDASGATPSGTIGLHHPSGDVRKVTAGPRPSTMGNCTIDNPADRTTHWWAGPYTQGTTEQGSSGSALFVPSDASGSERRVIGNLSGGSAQCSSQSPGQPNAGGDCYSKLAAGWNGDSASARLRDWLDPASTGRLSIAGGDQAAPEPPPPTRPHSTRALPPPLRLRPQR